MFFTRNLKLYIRYIKAGRVPGLLSDLCLFPADRPLPLRDEGPGTWPTMAKPPQLRHLGGPPVTIFPKRISKASVNGRTRVIIEAAFLL